MEWVALAFAMALAASALFSHIPASVAQQGQERRKGTETTPGGCFICGNLPGMHTAMFQGADWFGTVAWEACPIKKYSEDHPKELESVCQKIKTDLKITSFKVSCPSLASYCEPDKKEPPPETKCEKPTPWSDTSSSSGCKDVQDTRFTIDKGSPTATVSMCGSTVFTKRSEDFVKDEALAAAYLSALKNFFPKKICCDTFREAARTAKPCDPRQDVDCDGKPNQTDTDSDGFPAVNIFSRGDGAPIDPAGGDFDENPNFAPRPSDCECKWELVKGTVDCSPDGKGRDFYRATWRCPSNGVERSTRKERRAAKTWPCEQR